MQHVFGLNDAFLIAKRRVTEHLENVFLDGVERLNEHLIVEQLFSFGTALGLLKKGLFGIYHFLTVSIGFTPKPKM